MQIECDNFNIVDFDTQMGNAFFNLIDSNRERLEDFFAGTVSRTKTLEDTIDYCAVIAQRIKDKDYFPYIITNKSNDFIGLVDVKNISWNVPKAEIGYFIDSNYEGKGIITKALGAVADFLTQTYQFKKLLCRVNSKNQGSINVAIRNEFLLEGTIRNDYRTTKGEIVDLNYYGRIF
jgi:RimJ/RimL family protein N-acetyltransferase